MRLTWWTILIAAVAFGCNGHKTTSTGGGGNSPGNEMLVAADRTGNLYSIDPMTGADTLLLDTFTDDGMGGTTDVGVISSMVYLPSSGRLLAGTGGNAFCPACAMEVDLTTGQTTLLHDNSSVADGMAGMAVHLPEETVFATPGDSDSLLRVDPVTGVATGAGSFGTGTFSGNALTFAPNGALILAADQTLYAVSTVTAQATPVADMSFTGFPMFMNSVTIVSMATANDGTIYGIVQDGGGSGGGAGGAATYLATVNTTTGEVIFVGQFTHHLDGLVFLPTSP